MRAFYKIIYISYKYNHIRMAKKGKYSFRIYFKVSILKIVLNNRVLKY